MFKERLIKIRLFTFVHLFPNPICYVHLVSSGFFQLATFFFLLQCNIHQLFYLHTGDYVAIRRNKKVLQGFPAVCYFTCYALNNDQAEKLDSHLTCPSLKKALQLN